MSSEDTVDAVILAGGKGTRLRPFTVSIPKPLVPLGDQPIIEIVLHQLAVSGIQRSFIALGHLAELLKAYFQQVDHRHSMDIRFSVEEFPLGTLGPVKKIKDLGDTFLLLNGDILTTMPFQDVIQFHREKGYLATFAVHKRRMPVDYGVVDVSPDSQIIRHREKPSLDLHVGMGICVIEKKALEYVPEGKKFDTPDLINALLQDGIPVGAYLSEDYWMDIGRPEDYEIAHRDYTENPDRFLKPAPKEAVPSS